MKLLALALFLTGVCAQVQPGEMVNVQITSSGVARNFLLYVPVSRDPSTPIPVVLSFHGFTNSGSNQAQRSRGNEYAEQFGWAMLYPDGIGASFNGGICCGSASSQRVDDVQFSRDMVDELARRTQVNRNAVFAIGFSNGGFMSYRLACEGSDFITAIGPNAGRRGFGSDFNACNPSSPVPVVSITGTADFTIPYNGNPFLRFPSFADDIRNMNAANGCSGSSTTTQVSDTTSCQLFADCNGNAFNEFCTVQGGGHVWFEGGRNIDSTGYFLSKFARIAGLKDAGFLPPSNKTVAFVDDSVPTEDMIKKYQI